MAAQLLQHLLGTNVSESTVIAMCGIGKLFVADLIEVGACGFCVASFACS